MDPDNLLPQLLQGTRRRIVLLLRHHPRTVRELAKGLDLTRNAIRTQLSKLEADDLAEIVDRRPAERKPEHVYGLTEKAELLFPIPTTRSSTACWRYCPTGTRPSPPSST